MERTILLDFASVPAGLFDISNYIFKLQVDNLTPQNIADAIYNMSFVPSDSSLFLVTTRDTFHVSYQYSDLSHAQLPTYGIIMIRVCHKTFNNPLQGK